MVQQMKRKEVTNMNYTNTNYPVNFSLNSLTDKQLADLIENAEKEQADRANRKARWVRETYAQYLRHPNATCTQIDNTIIVSVYSRANGLRMCCSIPRHGDKFDRMTGVAVAFAKACGEPVPNYI